MTAHTLHDISSLPPHERPDQRRAVARARAVWAWLEAARLIHHANAPDYQPGERLPPGVDKAISWAHTQAQRSWRRLGGRRASRAWWRTVEAYEYEAYKRRRKGQ